MKASPGQFSWLLFGISFLSRLPFLFAGYGREEDAWSQVLNAKLIYETGVYEVSRLPGHPVYELLLALLWPLNHQYWFYNGLSAVVSAFSVVIFYQILKSIKVENAYRLSLAFSFIPVFFIAGTYTIDYNFALLLILWAWLNLQKGRVWLAALGIGLATGFRISSLAFLLPLSIIYGAGKPKYLLKFWSGSFVVALICFLPPLLVYGTGFLDFHKPPFPGWASIIYKMTIGVWGIPLLLSITVIKSRWIGQGSFTSLLKTENEFRRITFATLCGLVPVFPGVYATPLQSRVFLFPHWLFSWSSSVTWAAEDKLTWFWLPPSCPAFHLDLITLIHGGEQTPSAMAISFEAGSKSLFFDPLQGPALIDNSKRQNKSRLVNQTLAWCEGQKDSSVVIAGWYWPELELKKKKNLAVIFDYYSTPEEFQKYQKSEYRVYFLPEINEANHLINAHYLADSLGQVLDPL